VKQTFAHVGNPPKKPAIRDETEPLGFQIVGFESKHLGVTWFGYLVVLFGTRKC